MIGSRLDARGAVYVIQTALTKPEAGFRASRTSLKLASGQKDALLAAVPWTITSETRPHALRLSCCTAVLLQNDPFLPFALVVLLPVAGLDAARSAFATSAVTGVRKTSGKSVDNTAIYTLRRVFHSEGSWAKKDGRATLGARATNCQTSRRADLELLFWLGWMSVRAYGSHHGKACKGGKKTLLHVAGPNNSTDPPRAAKGQAFSCWRGQNSTCSISPHQIHGHHL